MAWLFMAKDFTQGVCCKSEPQHLLMALCKIALEAIGHTPCSACYPTYSNAIPNCMQVGIFII